MKTKVQSLHRFGNNIYDRRIVAIWRRSAPGSVDEIENRRQWKPLSPGLEEWVKNPQSDIGLLEVREDNYCFWANWLETNRGFVPVLDPDVFGKPLKWRVTDDNCVTEFECSEFSVPLSVEWLRETVAAITEEKSRAALRCVEGLISRFGKFLKRS